MHAVKPTHHVTVHHVDHRFGHGIIDTLVGQHTFLDDDVRHRLAILDDAHLVTRLAVEGLQVLDIAHRHDAHAVGAVVGLDHHKRFFVNAVFLVLATDLGEQGIHIAAQALQSFTLSEIYLAALPEHGVDQPRVDTQQLAKTLADLFVAVKVMALAAHTPAGMQRGQDMLFVQVFQDAGQTGTQVVVEQNGAGVKVLESQAALAANDRLERHAVAVRQVDGRRLLDLRIDRPHPHVQACHLKNALQLRHIAQIKGVAGVVFRNQQQVARFGTDFLDGRHGSLHRQRQHLGGQVVPAPRVQVGVHWRQLEAGIANVNRGVEGRGVLHPLQSEPALDGGHGIENALLEFVDRPGQGRDEMWNHETVRRIEVAL